MIDNVVRIGDLVGASGHLLHHPEQGDFLCPAYAFFGSNPGCSAFIPITNLDPLTWPGHDIREWWVANYVDFEGTWTGDSVRATDVTSATETDPIAGDPWFAPCSQPEGGWPGGGFDLEPETSELTRLVERSPGLYVGPWTGRVTNDEGAVVGEAIVVGTVGDVRHAQRELSGVYPFNLCAVESSFSNRDLPRIKRDLEARNDSWFVSIEPEIVLSVRALVRDQQLVDATAPLEPMVQLFTPLEKLADAPLGPLPATATKICGSLETERCEELISTARIFARPDLGDDAVLIAEVNCDPAWMTCAFVPPNFVVIYPGGCDTGPVGVAVLLDGRRLAFMDDGFGLPSYVARLLPEGCEFP
jgi:hypothetical protein